MIERKERGKRGGGASRPRERGGERGGAAAEGSGREAEGVGRRSRPKEAREEKQRGGAAQPPTRGERSAERARKGGGAAAEGREKRSESLRAAAPPVSKRSRKQRFLFFCWGLFSCGAFSFFFSPAPSLLVSYVAISLQRLRLALGRLRPFFHCVSRFSRDNNFQFSVFTFQFRFPLSSPLR